MSKIIISSIMLIALFCSPLWAQTAKQGWVIDDSRLYQKPFSDAEVVATLHADGVVAVIKRKGGWYQVESADNVSGWMRMNTLRFGEQKEDKGRGNVRGLRQTLKLFKTGRSGTSGVTVATGIRGLDSADLANSKPDHNALKQLSKYRSDRQASEKFAASAHLTSRELAFVQADRPSQNSPEPEENDWDE